MGTGIFIEDIIKDLESRGYSHEDAILLASLTQMPVLDDSDCDWEAIVDKWNSIPN